MFIGLKDLLSLWGGLKYWKRTDNLWQDHAAWFLFCFYVRCVMCLTFVHDCQILRLTKLQKSD